MEGFSELERRRRQKWQFATCEPPRWRCWAGEFVVYCPLSGKTHLLDVVAGRIFQLILDAPRSMDEILSELSAYLEVDEDTRLVELVDNTLNTWDELGLITSTD